MTPYYADDWLTVYLGDCREVMAAMEPESVHCVVTSPPYWGLRDYGIGGQLGLESTPEAYVEAMVAVFREVRRVLRKDGTVWLNLGDSYVSSNSAQGLDTLRARDVGRDAASGLQGHLNGTAVRPPMVAGLKPKDLVGIPWRVAFALQADGWYLRSDIIWSKPNPMPESVTDRPTKAHEYVFLLSKSPRYYYDSDAVRLGASVVLREPPERKVTDETVQHLVDGGASADLIEYAKTKVRATDKQRGHSRRHAGFNDRWDAMEREQQVASGANLRSVWNIATEPYPGAHFATFPRALVEPCIKAGTSEKGVCPECRAPWVRVVEHVRGPVAEVLNPKNVAKVEQGLHSRKTGLAQPGWRKEPVASSTTIGWRQTCACWPDLLPVPATVLDPFAGSGTTGLVAQSLSRRAVLIDLSADYLEQLMDRNRDIPLGLAGG